MRPKKVYTSYFNGYHGDRGVSIALSSPKSFTGRRIKEFAPSWSLMKKPMHEYVPEYKVNVLAVLDEKDVLSQIHDGDVLLCWEKPDDFCHRHLVASWLKKRGIEVEEIDNRIGLFE